MISGVTSTEFIVSQIINVTLLLITQIALTAIMGFWIFDFPMNGSYILAITMMFLQGICGKSVLFAQNTLTAQPDKQTKHSALSLNGIIKRCITVRIVSINGFFSGS